MAEIGEEDLFTFIYTSGTTGPPKGCMIRHRNYYEMAAVVDRMPRYVEPGDVCLLYLPLAHNFGRLVHLDGPFAGFAIAFEPDPYAVADALLAVRPTVLPSVPRVYEKVHAAVMSRFDEADRSEAPADRLGACRRARGRRAQTARRAHPAWSRGPPQAR